MKPDPEATITVKARDWLDLQKRNDELRKEVEWLRKERTAPGRPKDPRD